MNNVVRNYSLERGGAKSEAKRGGSPQLLVQKGCPLFRLAALYR